LSFLAAKEHKKAQKFMSQFIKDSEAEMTAMLGGVGLKVTLLDGTQEDVLVAALSFAKLPGFGDVVHDEVKLIELVCDRPAGWAVQVVQTHAEQIVLLGRELNEPPFYRWAARQNAALTRQIDMVTNLRNAVPASLRGSAPSAATPPPPPAS
jgi:hypothetical protein